MELIKMGKNSHLGLRKERVSNIKSSKLAHYIIITDTQKTEKLYFEGLKDCLPEELRGKIEIKVYKSRTEDLVEKALTLGAKAKNFSNVWIVFDRDLVPNFDNIIFDSIHKGIEVGWSNPCFEIWLAAYFGNMPTCDGSVQCCRKFSTMFYQGTGKKYNKNLRTLYKDLIDNGDEEEAFRIAERKLTVEQTQFEQPSRMCPATTVHRLVKEIRNTRK